MHMYRVYYILMFIETLTPGMGHDFNSCGILQLKMQGWVGRVTLCMGEKFHFGSSPDAVRRTAHRMGIGHHLRAQSPMRSAVSG